MELSSLKLSPKKAGVGGGRVKKCETLLFVTFNIISYIFTSFQTALKKPSLIRVKKLIVFLKRFFSYISGRNLQSLKNKKFLYYFKKSSL